MPIPAIKVWTEEILYPADLNAAFATIRNYVNANMVETTGAQTIGGVKTFSAVPVFASGITVTTGGITVSAGTSALKALTCTTLAATGSASLQAVTCTTLDCTSLTVSSSVSFAAVQCTALTVSGLSTLSGVVQAGSQASYKRHSGGDAGASQSIDWNNGNVHRYRLVLATTTPVFSNPRAGSLYMLELQQDVTGGRTVAWTGATILWAGGTAPVLTTTGNRKDVIALFCVDATGPGVYLGAAYGMDYANVTA